MGAILRIRSSAMRWITSRNVTTDQIKIHNYVSFVFPPPKATWLVNVSPRNSYGFCRFDSKWSIYLVHVIL